MIAIQSRTSANPDTSVDGVPFSSAKGEVAVAADKRRVEPNSSALISFKNARKLAVSFGEIVLQPRP